jgi:menaquinol-cytochrome c reductase iron-sulfur subunit
MLSVAIAALQPVYAPRASMSESSSPPKPADAPKDPGRRTLVVATCLGACALGAASAAPAITLALAPLSAKGGGRRWVRTVKLDQLKEREPRRVAIIDDRHDAWTVERGVELGSVWLVRHGENVKALSSVCPHLGCSVNAVASGFACPCHTSAFDGSGKRTSGPSPRDLDALETKIEDGHVAVDFRRFRIGVEEKVEAV